MSIALLVVPLILVALLEHSELAVNLVVLLQQLLQLFQRSPVKW